MIDVSDREVAVVVAVDDWVTNNGVAEDSFWEHGDIGVLASAQNPVRVPTPPNYLSNLSSTTGVSLACSGQQLQQRSGSPPTLATDAQRCHSGQRHCLKHSQARGL